MFTEEPTVVAGHILPSTTSTSSADDVPPPSTSSADDVPPPTSDDVPPDASTSSADDVPPQVSPPSETNMRGMFNFHASGPDHSNTLPIIINGKEVNFLREDDMVNSSRARQHFVAVERQREQLCWYTEFDAIMTPQNLYVNWCMLSTGDVICGVWETRCNYPYQALLLCTKETGFTKCVLMRCKEFRKKFKAATLTPGGRFDEELVKRYVVLYVCV